MTLFNPMKTSIHNGSLTQSVSLAIIAAAFIGPVCAEDYAQWRGPQRNGISTETGLLPEWPAEGPKLLWQVKDLGMGYSTPSVAGDRVYALGNDGLENEYVVALAVKDGQKLWQTRLGDVGNPQQKPSFPAARSTPTVEGERLYVISSDGDVACLETATGQIRWKKNLRSDFGGKPGTWAYSESPLIDGDSLVCAPGGSEATMLALNKNTGDVIWKAALPTGDEAAYTSAIVVEAAGVRQYVQMLEKGLAAVEARTGKLLWRYDKTVSAHRATIPMPLARNEYVYSAGSGVGGGLVRVKAVDGRVEAEQVYASSKLPWSIGSSILLGDYLYGTSNKGLICSDFMTGEIKWDQPALAAASLCYADGRLYLHGETGDIGLGEISPEGYQAKGRFTPPEQPKRRNQMEKAWTYPVVSNGRLYIRDHNLLWCYDVKAR